MSYYRIENRRPTVAEIRIDGVIGESWNEASTTAQRFVADLDKTQAQTLNVYINSPGGSLMDANVIMAALQRHPATVTVLIDGWALSAASLIAMAGQTVRMGERSLLMIHNPATAARGDARELRKAAEMLDKLKDGLVATYDRRLQQGPAAVAQLLDNETWYSAQDALAAGLIDGITQDHAAPSPIPKSLSNQIHIPAAYAAYCQESPMATATPQAPQDPSSVPPVASAAKTEPVTTPAPATASAAPAPEPVTTPAPVTAPSAAELDAAVQAGIQADRMRVKSIRAAFAPWTKRGYDLSALLSACEEGGDDLPTAHTKLLTQLGQMAEPLAVGQGLSDAQAAQLADSTVVADARRKLSHQVAGKKE